MPAHGFRAVHVALRVVEEHGGLRFQIEAGLCKLVDVGVRLAQFLYARHHGSTQQSLELRVLLEREMECVRRPVRQSPDMHSLFAQFGEQFLGAVDQLRQRIAIMLDVITVHFGDLVTLLRTHQFEHIREIRATVHEILVMEETIRIVVRTDVRYQLLGVHSVERRMALPVDQHAAEIKDDVAHRPVRRLVLAHVRLFLQLLQSVPASV